MGIGNHLETYRGLNRSIYFLCLAQVVNSIGHFIHPFLTMFLPQKMGMDPVEAGTYVMLSAAATLVPCAFLGVSLIIPRLLIASSFLQGVAEPVNDAMITEFTQV